MEYKENIITRNMLSKIRALQHTAENNHGLIKEEKEKKDSIAITDDPKFGNQVLTNQIKQFKTTVDGGAEFATPSDNVADCPLIYMPETKNLVFSGTIPRLNNLKFQFVLRTSTGNGCFIWADGLIMSDENMITLQKLYSFYLNWRDSWNVESSDLEILNKLIDKD